MTAIQVLRQPGTRGYTDRGLPRTAEGELFDTHAKRVASVVGAAVGNSPVNLEDVIWGL